jgi:hypothetical protein
MLAGLNGCRLHVGVVVWPRIVVAIDVSEAVIAAVIV